MHGRLKVKTSAEKQDAMKLEKQKKEKLFFETISAFFKTRSETPWEVFASQATLDSITAILRVAPEWFTLWNTRRKIIQHFFSRTHDTRNHHDHNGHGHDDNDREDDNQESLLDADQIYKKELDLTLCCLMENPKQYCVWQHRCWTMLQMSAPDWSAELQLCNKALNLDERNFHCWDYRRFVVKHGNIALADEVLYTREKLKDISNFSSWHYRYTLLSSQMPTTGGDVGIMERELNLVHNAIFTDPSDQSAWFYYRWPLGKVLQAGRAQLHRIDFGRSDAEVIVSFNQAVPRHHLQEAQLWHCHGELESEQQWQAVVPEEWSWRSPINGDYSCIWYCSLKECLPETWNVHLKFTFQYQKQPFSITLLDGQQEASVRGGEEEEKLQNALTLLVEEWKLMRELYAEEPTNKWVLLNCMQLFFTVSEHLEAADRQEFQVEEVVQKLVEVDPMRSEFYRASHSHWIIQRQLATWHSRPECSLNLANLSLTSLSSLHWLSLLCSLDLSHNQLTILPEELGYLLMLKDLNLDHNQLQSLKNIQYLRNVREVSVQHNLLSEFDQFSYALHCPRLRTINIQGNGVTSDTEFTRKVSENPGTRAHKHPISILYEWSIK